MLVGISCQHQPERLQDAASYSTPLLDWVNNACDGLVGGIKGACGASFSLCPERLQLQVVMSANRRV